VELNNVCVFESSNIHIDYKQELLQSENDSIKSQLAELLKTKLQADEVFQTSQVHIHLCKYKCVCIYVYDVYIDI
jgi:hypothetical protein